MMTFLQSRRQLDRRPRVHTRSLYFKNERVTTLNGRRKPLGLLHPAIPSRAHWNPAQLPSNQQNGAAARLAQLWARSQNGGALRPGEHWQRGFRRGNAATIFIQLEFKLSSPFVPESASPFSRPSYPRVGDRTESVAAEHRGIK